MNLQEIRNIYKKNFTSNLKHSKGAINLIKKKCPECDADLEVPDDVISGEIISCPDCGMDYEVIVKGEGKIELKPAEIEGEDWGE